MRVEHDGDDREVLGDHLVDLAVLLPALVVIRDLTCGVDCLVDVGVDVLGVVVVSRAVEVGIDKVIHSGIVCNPAQTTNLVLAAGKRGQVACPLHGGLLHLEADGLEVVLDDGHDVLVATAGVVGERDLLASEVVLVDDLLRGVLVVLRELPEVLLVVVDDGRHEARGRLAGALEQLVDNLLTVDGERHCLADVEVLHGLIVQVERQVVDRGLGASDDLVLRAAGVAVLGLAVLLLRILDAAGRDGREVHVASLELVECSLRILLDGEVDLLQRRLLAIVVVKALDVDVLARLPLADHHEGTVADGLGKELLGVVGRGLGDRGKRGVAADVREVRHRGVQLHDEGVVVGAGDAGELRRGTLLHLVVADDGSEVVVNLRRGRHLRVADALPATLEVSRSDLVAVVELGALHQVEGELGGVVVDLPGLGGLRNDLLLVPVVVAQRVEEDVLDLRALGLLGVVGVDSDGVVDVELHAAVVGTGLAGTTLLAAGCERSECACGQAALHEGATAHHELVCHTILLFPTSRPMATPDRPCRHGSETPIRRF